MKTYYLEIVTSDVDAICKSYAHIHQLEFGECEPMLGGARIAKLEDGAMVGVREPMRDTESAIVRHYVLVNDIQASVHAAEKLGAEVAVPPMSLGTYGSCAIVIQGGIESGFWQR
ncbi:VOC family protein [Agaribacterium sp. ZY112]|uniref:VOC family protein n=1 Tax=Agaribacterium sp. ZY112 TaxID=3233574 RepID=UPI0035243A3E